MVGWIIAFLFALIILVIIIKMSTRRNSNFSEQSIFHKAAQFGGKCCNKVASGFKI